MQYRIIPASEIESSGLSFWQSPNWADILTESGQAREVFYFGHVGSSYLLIEIRAIGLRLYGAFSLGVSSSQIGSDWEEMIADLQKYLKNKNILFLQIEPIDREIQGNNTQKPYKNFLTPHTRVLDLTLAEDEILAQMHEK
jgi:lipid II:glycine glycyltransferase (peptidoglycan interpeptide bridge formation enzyme)